MIFGKLLHPLPSPSPKTTTTTIDDNPFTASTTTQNLKSAIKQYFMTNYKKRCNRKNNKSLNQCRKHLGIDPDSLIINVIWRTYLMYLLPTWLNYQSSTTALSELPSSNQIIKISFIYLSQCAYFYFYLPPPSLIQCLLYSIVFQSHHQHHTTNAFISKLCGQNCATSFNHRQLYKIDNSENDAHNFR